MKIDENFIYYELSDEELENMTFEEFKEFDDYVQEHGLNEAMTIKGLLKKQGFKYDDLPLWVQEFYVGKCNNANRTKNQIYINRENSPIKTNIKINLNKNREVPYMTHQIQISDGFIHEDGYDEDGNLLYQS